MIPAANWEGDHISTPCAERGGQDLALGDIWVWMRPAADNNWGVDNVGGASLGARGDRGWQELALTDQWVWVRTERCARPSVCSVTRGDRGWQKLALVDISD